MIEAVSTPSGLSRRRLIAAAGALGVSLTFVGHSAQAATSRKRFILIILRGAADGLSISPPLGDPHYEGLRRNLAIAQALRLNGDFGLHPELKTVHRLAGEGQARIAPAIAMPDRIRSHFEAQDKLETGAAADVNAGWLNRVLAELSERRPVEALSVGAVTPLVLRGPAQAAAWSPGATVDAEARLPALISALYENDAALSAAFASGLKTEALAQMSLAQLNEAAGAPKPAQLTGAQPEAARRLGGAVAGFMTEDTPIDLVAISLDGFDTHAAQTSQLSRRLAYVDALIEGLHAGLGPAWKDTVVLAVTEFGRTARVNGTNGTDHGTASTALLLGGGLKPGGIIGDWPGLAPAKLYEDRDLAPTLDMRGLFKGVLLDHMGLDRRALDNRIFPDSAGTRPLTGLV